jgi:hypothetical protein
LRKNGVARTDTEYVTSRAAAWDCPISLSDGHSNLMSALESHPRTPDNLEVVRRWEDVRARNWLTQEQKLALRKLEQEHTLLVDEGGQFVLVPWEQIEGLETTPDSLRAFIFERNGNVWVAYWHPSGEGSLELNLQATHMTLMREPGKATTLKRKGQGAILPLGERRYLEFSGLSREEVSAAFRSAKALPG